MAQNRADEAKAVLSTGLASNPENQGIHFDLFWVSAALGDEAGMQRELQWASGKLAGVNLLGVAATARAAYLGKLKSARELSTQALQIARENNFKDSGAGVAAFEALLEAEVGNFGQARERAAASLALSRTRTNLPAIAVTLALAGDSKQAQGIVDELHRRYPVDTVANDVFIPCAQALLESNRGDPAQGIQALQVASRYELGPVYSFLPIYVRGLIYLHARKGQQAAAEFQRILNYRALGEIVPAYALSYVGLARAYALTGDSAKSRKLIRTSSHSGKMPTLTFPSLRKLRPSTRSCSKPPGKSAVFPIRERMEKKSIRITYRFTASVIYKPSSPQSGLTLIHFQVSALCHASSA